ncbi:hypothetical protein [Escherichia albertii]|uniref:hypothetical protein n=1 Tax=Escherichia albertii TaxID=208962 RepID=UPI0011F3078F|nr:hypothetical protein [Escherichia albertii]
MPDATLTRLIRPTSLHPNRRPDKAFTPHPAICAPTPDATLMRLIRPTSLRPNGRPDKAFTPHQAIVHQCLMRR